MKIVFNKLKFKIKRVNLIDIILKFLTHLFYRKIIKIVTEILDLGANRAIKLMENKLILNISIDLYEEFKRVQEKQNHSRGYDKNYKCRRLHIILRKRTLKDGEIKAFEKKMIRKQIVKITIKLE